MNEEMTVKCIRLAENRKLHIRYIQKGGRNGIFAHHWKYMESGKIEKRELFEN